MTQPQYPERHKWLAPTMDDADPFVQQYACVLVSFYSGSSPQIAEKHDESLWRYQQGEGHQ